ncbi:lysozyme [Pusillimonas sp. ANT_WB101]|uniref:lysozyme n=1 Tax=Pusillimonas sp. ANT_WB101 TaxID=2597356 RepID=UPI0011F059BF|nr:lysozyme [Pusillimonas sp. ANT_WB101]KAA0910695.1 lysozyme [Pusillimonas sp. ANT_WB101]
MIDFLKRLLMLLSGLSAAPAKSEPVLEVRPEPTLEITPEPVTMGDEGQKVLKYFEQCRLKAYWDATGKVWTIGWGHTGPDVYEGLVITQARADQLLRDRLAREFVPGVLGAVTCSMAQHELDAMVDLAYNIGVVAFAGSTLVRKFNAGDAAGAADEFPRWNKSGGQVLLGLRRRRAANRALFLGASGDAAIKIGVAVT